MLTTHYQCYTHKYFDENTQSQIRYKHTHVQTYSINSALLLLRLLCNVRMSNQLIYYAWRLFFSYLLLPIRRYVHLYLKRVWFSVVFVVLSTRILYFAVTVFECLSKLNIFQLKLFYPLLIYMNLWQI